MTLYMYLKFHFFHLIQYNLIQSKITHYHNTILLNVHLSYHYQNFQSKSIIKQTINFKTNFVWRYCSTLFFIYVSIKKKRLFFENFCKLQCSCENEFIKHFFLLHVVKQHDIFQGLSNEHNNFNYFKSALLAYFSVLRTDMISIKVSHESLFFLFVTYLFGFKVTEILL